MRILFRKIGLRVELVVNPIPSTFVLEAAVRYIVDSGRRVAETVRDTLGLCIVCI